MGFMSKIDIGGAIVGVILVIVFLQVIANTIGTVGTASETLGNMTGLPLATFFAENGLLILVFVAATFLLVLKAMGIGKGR